MEEKLIQTTPTADSVNYQGNITISVLQQNRVIKKFTVHNNGTKNLYKYLADCLCGTVQGSSVAASGFPCKLVLFRNVYSESGTAKGWNEWTEAMAASQPVYFDGSVVRADSADGSTAIFHFRVPFLYMISDASKITVDGIGLFPNQVLYGGDTNNSTMCAYHVLGNDQKINIPNSGGNFTIIVDWELKILGPTTTSTQ